MPLEFWAVAASALALVAVVTLDAIKRRPLSEVDRGERWAEWKDFD